MGRIAKVIKIAHFRPRYHLTGVLAPSQAGGEPALLVRAEAEPSSSTPGLLRGSETH
jgi:hypothetical protein